jgi:hypothetical protein
MSAIPEAPLSSMLNFEQWWFKIRASESSTVVRKSNGNDRNEGGANDYCLRSVPWSNINLDQRQ